MANAVTVGSSAAVTLAGRIALKSVPVGSVVVNAVRVTNGMTNEITELSTRRKFSGHLTDIYNCEKQQSQKEKPHEKMWGMVKDFITVEVLHKKCRVSGIPDDHSFQAVFNIFKGNEKCGFILLNSETANTSAQNAPQISFDFNPLNTELNPICQ